MNKYPFREAEELRELEVYPKFPMPYGEPGAVIRRFNTPITPKENFERMCNGEGPLWIPELLCGFQFYPAACDEGCGGKMAWGRRLVWNRMAV